MISVPLIDLTRVDLISWSFGFVVGISCLTIVEYSSNFSIDFHEDEVSSSFFSQKLRTQNIHKRTTAMNHLTGRNVIL